MKSIQNLCILILIRFSLLSCQNVDMEVDKSYQSHCTINNFTIPCQVALFSMYNFNISVKMPISKELKYLCDNQETELSQENPNNQQIGITTRGQCAFDEKAKNAIKQRYKGLIVVNTDDSVFPVGSQSQDYKSSIPVVMIGKSSYYDLFNSSDYCLPNEYQDTCQSRIENVFISIHYSKTYLLS